RSSLNTTLSTLYTAFVLWADWLPGHYGCVSQALLRTTHLRQALDILIEHQASLSPLLVPHLLIQHGHGGLGGDGLAVLYWTDTGVPAAQRVFVVDMMMAAVSGMSRWLSGERLPWQFRFNRTPPAHPEQYAVHLGADVRFNAYL
ncbi:AraC family transcriptional regulator ligand-binding domain-containing protein, partial [Leptospira sp. SA-E8]|uniref:AraC family transcriptional regulator ligand-binding domain-containing protein n=1 Tax=Leptospira sp. SA-E8 TaxID=3422259 RepID=UPI003EBA0283